MHINWFPLLLLIFLAVEVISHYHHLKKHSDLEPHSLDHEVIKEGDDKVSSVYSKPHRHLPSFKTSSQKNASQRVSRSIGLSKRFVFGRNHQSDTLHLRAYPSHFINSKIGLRRNVNLINAAPFVVADKPDTTYVNYVFNRLFQPYSVRNFNKQNPWENILLKVENTLEKIRKFQNETSRNLANQPALNGSPNLKLLQKEEDNQRQFETAHTSTISGEKLSISTTTFKPFIINWNARPGSHSFPTFPPVMFNLPYTEDMFIKNNSAKTDRISDLKTSYNKRRTIKSTFGDGSDNTGFFKKVHQHNHFGKPHHQHVHKLPHHHRCHNSDEKGFNHHHGSNHASSHCLHSFNGVNNLNNPEINTPTTYAQELKNVFQSDTVRRLDTTLNLTTVTAQPNSANETTSKLISEHVHINHEIETSTKYFNASSSMANNTQDKNNTRKILCKDGGTVEIPVLNINLPCGDLSSNGGHPDDFYKREFAESMTGALKDYIEEEKETINEENHDIDIRLGRTKRNLKDYKKPERIVYNSSNENKINGKSFKVYKERNISVFGEIMDMPKDLSSNDSTDYFDLSMLSEYFLEAVESLDEASLVDVLKALKEDYLSKSPGDQSVVDEVYEKLVTSLLDYKRAAGNWTERRRRESPSKAKEGPAAVLELLAETDKFLESEMQDDPFANDYSGEYNDKDHEREINDNPSFLELVSLADKHKSNIKS